MTMISPAYAAYIQNVDGTWFWYEGFDDDTDEIDPSLYQYSGTYWDESFQKLLILQLNPEDSNVVFEDLRYTNNEALYSPIYAMDIINTNEIVCTANGGLGNNVYINGENLYGVYTLHLWLYDGYIDYTLNGIKAGRANPEDFLADSSGRLYRN